MSTPTATAISEQDVERAMQGETVFVTFPGGVVVRLMFRRKMLYLQRMEDDDIIRDGTPPGEGSGS